MKTSTPIDVLVVDDDRETVESLTALLTANGFTVVGLSSPRKALARLDEGLRPRAMIVDYLMPEMSGAELIDEKNRRPEIAKVPVVLLTGARPPAVGVDCIHFLEKPVLPEALVMIIRQVTRASGDATRTDSFRKNP